MKPGKTDQKKKRSPFELNYFSISIIVLFIIAGLVTIIFISQNIVEKGALKLSPQVIVSTPKEKYELAKLSAEINQILSDTSGSLFWLKLIALFVTVGGAVGGYLIGQSEITRKRLQFEHRKDVDIAYQAIVLELSSKEDILRAAAAVKLGAILQRFPTEWDVTDDRRKELIQLTKQVLAAALSIEANSKVLKTITIALVLDKSLPMVVGDKTVNFADVRELDLSNADGRDAYWARSDFSYADFYNAKLSQTSFRSSILKKAQFRESHLNDAVFIETDCEEANFKMADLRNANFSEANLKKAEFDGAKVHGMNLHKAKFTGSLKNFKVDSSIKGDGSHLVELSKWLEESNFTG
jgi:uncharacterized protein YjbI with pentapeptide repeats